jgi:hypothetical protein
MDRSPAQLPNIRVLTRAALFWLWPPAAPCHSWLLLQFLGGLLLKQSLVRLCAGEANFADLAPTGE